MARAGGVLPTPFRSAEYTQPTLAHQAPLHKAGFFFGVTGMDIHKVADCVLGGSCGAAGLWLGDHWMAIGGGALLAWRLVQAFILEPMGIFWPRPRDRSQDGTNY